MKNIIVAGGGLVNKGAQAMTFVTVSELSKRFPNHQIYILSEFDSKREESELNNYKFKIIKWYPMKYARANKNAFLRLMCMLRNNKEYSEISNIYKNADLFVDISGYAIGSVWSDAICNNYLDNIEFALLYDLPVYLLPQSFGPFEYKNPSESKILDRIKSLLPKAKIIFAREQSGFDALGNIISTNNVRLADDIVLSNREIDYSTVYYEVPRQSFSVEKNSVCIIPNDRIIQVGKYDELMSYYHVIIPKLIELNKTVYFVKHSDYDAKLLNTIKDEFKSFEGKLVFIEDSLGCIEFAELLMQFDFVISSRFHSIVFSYKNGIPCIALGWADKYGDLLSKFGQSEYFVDMREKYDEQRTFQLIERINSQREEESHTIQKYLAIIQKHTAFDDIDSLSE